MTGVVKSAARVLEIFEFFAHRQGPATVSEVATALEFPVSSTSVLLKSLLDLGYLEHQPRSREYLPTIRFAVLGSWMLDRFFSDAEPVPRLMDELQRSTEETIVLAMEHALYLDYIRILQSIAPVRFHLKPGVRRPIWRAAAGQVLMAQWPTERVEKVLQAANSDPANPRVPIQEFIGVLSRIRAQGYALTEGQITPDAAMIAVAIPVGGGHRPLALAVCGPRERIRRKEQEIVQTMQALLRRPLPPHPAAPPPA